MNFLDALPGDQLHNLLVNKICSIIELDGGDLDGQLHGARGPNLPHVTVQRAKIGGRTVHIEVRVDPDEIIQVHPDDKTTCPEYSWPFRGQCDRIGTGIHAGMATLNDTHSYQEATDLMREAKIRATIRAYVSPEEM